MRTSSTRRRREHAQLTDGELSRLTTNTSDHDRSLAPELSESAPRIERLMNATPASPLGTHRGRQFLSEVAVMVVFFLLLIAARLAGVPEIARPMSPLDYVDALVSSFGMVFLFTLWVGKRIDSGFVLHGALVGVVGILLFTIMWVSTNRSLAQPPVNRGSWPEGLGGIAGRLVVLRRRQRAPIVMHETTARLAFALWLTASWANADAGCGMVFGGDWAFRSRRLPGGPRSTMLRSPPARRGAGHPGDDDRRCAGDDVRHRQRQERAESRPVRRRRPAAISIRQAERHRRFDPGCPSAALRHSRLTWPTIAITS